MNLIFYLFWFGKSVNIINFKIAQAQIFPSAKIDSEESFLNSLSSPSEKLERVSFELSIRTK